MRIIIKTSKWAIWARRLASFALPLLVVPVIMHREQWLTTSDFGTLLVWAMAIAMLALLVGMGALIRLWFTGERGWGKALSGIVLALICLSPAFYAGFEYTRYPALHDISTDLVDPPQMVSPLPQRHADLSLLAQAEEAFPNAQSRRYQLPAPVLFELIDGLVAARGWQVLIDEPPADALGTGRINALDTRLFGWREEVAIRLRGDEAGSSVAMRSASLTNVFHDLGSNGRRTENFLVELDDAVTAYLRDTPVASEEVEPEGAEEE